MDNITLHDLCNTLPEINKTYDYFDDGKIKESRRMPVTITDIIPFNEIDEETLSLWKDEIEEIDWVYAKETDYFIKGDLKLSQNEIEKIVFVRTLDDGDGWFSLGWWSGVLDVNRDLFKRLINV